MPFTNRDKPRLFERIRGRSGRDLVNEVKSVFDRDNRRMFFDTPSWSNSHSSFPRGFPFNDEEPLRSESYFPRSRVFQDFHEPPWDEDRENKRRVPDPEEPVEPSEPPRPSLNQYGLRNTVPLAKPAEVERPIRAMSAPPCDRPLTFTSSCEIPIMGESMSSQSAPQNPPTSSNNVRVIPIQVEGRDEPLINSNIDTSSNFAETSSTFDARLPRDFAPFRKHSARFQQSQPQQQQTTPPPQHQPKSKQQTTQPKSKQQEQETATPSKSVDEPDRTVVPPPDPTAIALSRIAEVQNQVELLAKEVDSSCVTSRSDKQYVYLDEMLTRQLLSLDNVDPAGQDNIRQARRDAIKAIQKCISILESKVPTESMDVEPSLETTDINDKTEGEPMDNEGSKMDETAVVEPMVVSEISENSVVNSDSKQKTEDLPT